MIGLLVLLTVDWGIGAYTGTSWGLGSYALAAAKLTILLALVIPKWKHMRWLPG